jgi:hypothetical protein
MASDEPAPRSAKEVYFLIFPSASALTAFSVFALGGSTKMEKHLHPIAPKIQTLLKSFSGTHRNIVDSEAFDRANTKYDFFVAFLLPHFVVRSG